MGLGLKPVSEQAIVIVGGSSGIGLSTARMAARRGAKLVLAARNGEALSEIVAELGRQGAEAVAVPADVADKADVERIAETAMDRFGRIDSWVNCAAIAVYGELDQVPEEDHRRLFDVNYFGLVTCSLVAMRHLREEGGTLVNIGSVLSDFAVPLQGPYVAAKHAVKGFTDTLRIEAEKNGFPISVTLIKPNGVDTPYEEHARTHLENAPRVPPVVYAPHLVARAILHACETPTRTIYVGGAGVGLAALANHAPRLYDWVAKQLYDLQTTDKPATAEPDRRDNLYQPKADGAERSRHGRGVRETSLFTEMQMRPMASVAAIAGAAAVLRLLLGRRR